MDWRPDAQKVNRYLLDPTTPAIVVFSVIVAVLDPDELIDETDGHIADPIAIWHAIRSKLSIDLPAENESKFNAIITALDSNVHEVIPDAFNAIVIGITRGDMDNLVDTMEDDVTVNEIVETINTLQVLDTDPITLSPAVKRFIADELREEAIDPEDPVISDTNTLEEILMAFSDLGMTDDMLREFADSWVASDNLANVL